MVPAHKWGKKATGIGGKKGTWVATGKGPPFAKNKKNKKVREQRGDQRGGKKKVGDQEEGNDGGGGGVSEKIAVRGNLKKNRKRTE